MYIRICCLCQSSFKSDNVSDSVCIECRFASDKFNKLKDNFKNINFLYVYS